MPPIALERLHNALGAALIIREAVRDHSFEQYVADEWFRSANERQLEIIGEALNHARRSAPEIVDQFPSIGEWIALRNVLSHVYMRINHVLVWRTTTTEIPGLIETLERMLATSEASEDA